MPADILRVATSFLYLARCHTASGLFLSPMHFVGIDLAWGVRNTTAVVALTLGKSLAPTLYVQAWREALRTNDEMVAFVQEIDNHSGLLVGIDAPLIVPNLTGERPCETQLRKYFGRYEAGPLPANRQMCGGRLRGEQLVHQLYTQLGLLCDYRFQPQDVTVRRCLEVFPRSAQTALFGLAQSLKYKAKPGRTLESRLAELKRYVHLLKSLHAAPLALIPPKWLEEPKLHGSPLKRYEDLLDALLCAYIVAYYWYHGEGAYCHVFGTMEQGYILTPILTPPT